MWLLVVVFIAVLWNLGLLLTAYLNIPWLFLLFGAISFMLLRLKQFPRLKWLCIMLAAQGIAPLVPLVQKAFGTLNPYVLLTGWHWPDFIAGPIAFVVFIIGLQLTTALAALSFVSAAVVIVGENQ